MGKPDEKALQVATLVHQRENPELTILFGSRSRGDHDSQSDIDILLLSPTIPPRKHQMAAEQAADADASFAYGQEVPVQITWDTLASFRYNRRYVNSLHTNAVRDGVVMPRNPMEYSASDYEDENNEYLFDWSTYDARINEAQDALTLFEQAQAMGLNEATVGRQAQQALEYGLKALLEAIAPQYQESHGETLRYREVHDIGELLGNVRHYYPELRDFRRAISPEIYSNYGGRRGYLISSHSVPWLSEQDDYVENTVNDARFIIGHARALRDQYH